MDPLSIATITNPLLAAVIFGILAMVIALVTAKAIHSLSRRPPGRETGLHGLERLADTHALDHWVNNRKRGARLGALSVEITALSEFANLFGTELAERSMLELADRLARLAGGEGIIGRTTANDIVLLADEALVRQLTAGSEQDLRLQLSHMMTLGGCWVSPRLRLGASVGIAGIDRARGLVADARAAMSGASPDAPAVAFHAQQRRGQAARHRLLREISTGFARSEFLPYFQPQIDTFSGHVTGFEALARWRHPNRGVLAPAEFLAPLEKAGLTTRLGQVMVSRSTQALAGWRRAGLKVGTLSLNFSAAELRNPEMADRLLFDLDRAGLSTHDLRIEVLESTVITRDDDPVLTAVRRLHELGVLIDLDDFGTGQASISNIGRLGADRIKIDRNFVSMIDLQPDLKRMTKAMIEMAKTLEIDVLAEGVETNGEWAALFELGCRGLQGHAIAPPMPADSVEHWMRGYQNSLAQTENRNARAAG